MGRKGKMKHVNQCCRTLISRGLDHSHWFFCLSVCTACGVERSGGRCLHCRWLLCGQGGSLRVDDMHSTDVSTCGWRPMRFRNGFSQKKKKCWHSRGATCYVMDQSAFFSLCFWLRSVYLQICSRQLVESFASKSDINSWCLRRENPDFGV